MISISVLAIVSNAKADFVFGTPVSTGTGWIAPCFSADGLDVYFHLGSDYVASIWTAHRDSRDDEWGPAVDLGPTVNSSGFDGIPWLSPNKLELHFESNRGGGNYDVWVTTRATVDDDWGTPVNLGASVNTAGEDGCLSLSADGLELYMVSDRAGGSGGWDLWVARRATLNDAWEAPVNLGPTINTSAMENFPCLSADGLCLFFASTRPGGHGGLDLYMARRATVSDPWGTPVNLGPSVNSSSHENCARISADGGTLYFLSMRPGGILSQDLWQVPLIPIVDFNGDDVVNAEDMSIMIHYWGQNEPLCDIGPTPLGDGVVDVHDLIVLAEHLAPGLETVAHWKLDESSGAIAHDSIGGSDATVVGDATWRPEDGLIDGAMELDGVDDHVITDFISDPKAGPVRVVCWVKTEVAGGAIVSQTPSTAFGSTWLATDAADGTLLTEMMFPLPSLHSTYVVADGQWHKVSAEWDGVYRRLWADDQEVAKGALPMALPPLSWNGTLIIGAGPNLESGTFLAGLIDDVRIYNRAVQP
jgi:hypothetical protein